jgi:purine-nucleoside phosphorylase
MDVEVTIPYEDIPHFPTSTVESHAGRLLFGVLAGRSVVVLQGRFHLYEGYTPYEVTLPIRVFGGLGVRAVVVSNAAGGMNPVFRRGDLMLVSDHINLQGANPLVGPNHEAWGPRFPDMSEPYDVLLRQIARRSAAKVATPMHEGVYAAVLGPLLETRAEYRFLRGIGGDAVGMSTVPEVIVARHMDMRVAALSVITDECFPDTLQPVDITEILAAAKSAEPALTTIMQDIVAAC